MFYALLLASMVSLQPGPIADATPAGGTATPTVSAPVEDPKVTALAKSQFIAFQSGKVDRTLYSKTAAAAFTDAIVAQAASQLAPLGAIKTITLSASQSYQGDMVYSYVLTCANGTVREVLALTPDGLIDGLRFAPG